jgi:DNA-directed RNA polymerase subunit K/omega
MVQRPTDIGVFEFAIVSGLRAAQLTRGCVPRVTGVHKIAVIAQMEVAGRHVERAENVRVGEFLS